jgi:hypothetical protein
MRRGAWAWFHDDWPCSAKVLEFWMISSLKIKLNHSWKFWRNWNVHVVLLERSWWAWFNGIYLVKFWIQNLGDIDFKVISAAESSDKFQKNQVLERKISWGLGNTWANGTGHTSYDDKPCFLGYIMSPNYRMIHKLFYCQLWCVALLWIITNPHTSQIWKKKQGSQLYNYFSFLKIL